MRSVYAPIKKSGEITTATPPQNFICIMMKNEFF